MRTPKIPGLLLSAFLVFSGAAGQEKSAEQLKARLTESGFRGERVERIFSDQRFCIYHDLPGIRSKARKIDYIERGFCSDESVEDGLGFLLRNIDPLVRAKKKYGVGGEYVVALLKMESDLSRNMGSRPVINSLASNWFYSDSFTEKGRKRENLFYGEIAELLKMEGVLYDDDNDIFSLKGSYGGAFGWPQSLPSSYRIFGVDFDGDGDIDITDREDPDDAIGFIANYLAKQGFEKDRFSAIQSYNPNDGERFPRAIMAYAEKLREKLTDYVSPVIR